MGSRLAKLGASSPNSEVTFISSGSVSINAAGVGRLELIVEAANVSGAGLAGPLAVIADQKVSHRLTEGGRFDFNLGLRLDGDFHLDEVRQARLAGGDPHQQLDRPFLGRSLDRVVGLRRRPALVVACQATAGEQDRRVQKDEG
jgi:hypothetical protein